MNDTDSFSHWEQVCMASAELKLASLNARAEQGPATYSWHSHPFIEWGLVLEGRCSWEFNAVRYDLAEGEMILVPRGVVHRELIAAGEQARLSWVGFTSGTDDGSVQTQQTAVSVLDGSPMVSSSGRYAQAADSRPLVLQGDASLTRIWQFAAADALEPQSGLLLPCKLELGRWKEEVRRLFLTIYDEQSQSAFGGEARIRLCLAELLLLTLRALLAQKSAADSERAATHSSDIPQRQVQLAHAASRFFDNNTGQGVRVEAVARYFRLTPQHFSTLFRKVHGVSPVQYLQGARVRQARRLLGGSQLSIKEIANRCGYADSAHFCRHFKAQIGRSPTQYRLHGEAL